ncbi:DUF445 family protein [Selenomonas sp.]|uniref:DUF445 family protein n=1 Tax=Selenomonas sp. TaxID=2053611 RepID=UPI003FA1F243
MFWRSWNKADKTLLLAAVIFFLALALVIAYPKSLLARGFLACADAALVGGIADWFAVTALFKKPLGFPWHTALLPRRRESFIEASVTLVQKEFFSRRKIFQALQHINLVTRLIEFLRETAVQEKLVLQFLHYVRSFAMHIDREQQARAFADEMRGELSRTRPAEIFSLIGRWMRDDERDHVLVSRAAQFLADKIAAPAFSEKVEDLLFNYAKENTKGAWGKFLLGIGQMTDVLNFSDLAELVRRQALSVLMELAKRDSPLQQEFLSICYAKAEELCTDEDFCAFSLELRDTLLAGLPLEEAIERSLAFVQKHFFAARQRRSFDAVLPMLRENFSAVLVEELRRTLVLFSEDEKMQRAINRFLYDLAARSALAAQELVGIIVRDVLARLTDEQLNHLVYDKVEPDLLWIRMNGSIVGAGIGLIIFVILQIVH